MEKPNSLQITHRFLADEHERMQEASGLVNQISTNFNDANQTYTEYTSKINKSSNLVKEIKRKEYWDHAKMHASYYAFLGTSAYLFLKRFYFD